MLHDSIRTHGERPQLLVTFQPRVMQYSVAILDSVWSPQLTCAGPGGTQEPSLRWPWSVVSRQHSTLELKSRDGLQAKHGLELGD